MKLRTWCIRMGQILTKTVLVFTGFLISLTLFNPTVTKAENNWGGITIRQQNVPIEKVFQSIEKQSGYRFFYNETLLQGAGKVTINLQNVSLQEALEACFQNQPLSYAIVDKTIIVKRRPEQQPKAPELAAVSASRPGKIIALRGKVTSNKVPVPDASIMVKGTDNGAKSDKDGMFTLPEVEDDATLVISTVSHQPREVRLTGQTFISIDLSQRTDDLDEAVVVAYNTTTRRMNTGAVSVIKGSDVQNLPNRSVDKSLQGMVPGLLVTSGNGQPGSGVSNFVLRGISSAVDPSEASVRNPLIIIDGIPVTQDHFQIYIDNVRTPITNPLAQLNPSDIETITVLKDASAIALYGARASNGVIVITTKKGRAGKTIFSLRHQTDISSPIDGKVDVLNQEEYLELVTESLANWKPYYNDYSKAIDTLKTLFPVTSDRNFYPQPDWYGELFNKSAVTVSNEISMSGGNDRNNFYLNFESTKQSGVLKKTGYDRKSIRFNFENRPANWIKLGLNSTVSYNIQDYGGATRGYDGPVTSSMSPLNAIMDENGNYIYNFKIGGGPQSASEFANPAAAAAFNTNRNTSFRGLSKLYAEINFLKYFKFNSSVGFDFMLSESKEKADPRLVDPGSFAAGIGRVEELSVRRANVVTTNVLRFDKTINDVHGVNVILGQEAQILTQKNLLVSVKNLGLPYYDQITSPGVAIQSFGGYSTKETLLSYFSQANYGFKNKYFLTASVRRDGSSRFGEDKRFGTYWSTGVGYVISSESFMKGVSSWLNYLKIRGSIGKAGNAAAINRFTRFDQLQNSTFLGGTAVYPTTVPGSPDVHWESTFSWDAGLDVRFLNERLTFTLDLYKKNTSDLIYAVQLPYNSGYFQVLSNIGEMENKGAEFSLSADIIRSRKLRWNISGNWSTNQNKLIRSNVEDAAYVSSQLGNKVGEDFNSFYLVEWAGVDQADGSPQWLDTDGNITKTFPNNAARKFVGKPQPDGFGAVTNTITYNNFSLSVLFYYQYGYKIFISDELVNDGAYPFMNQDKRALDRWRKPGDVAANPKRIFNNSNGSSAGKPSTRYLFDGGHIRLQNITLSYNFPGAISKRLHLGMLKMFVQGNNLKTWTKFPGQDPGNVNVGGTVGLRYPNQQSYSIGINASF